MCTDTCGPRAMRSLPRSSPKSSGNGDLRTLAPLPDAADPGDGRTSRPGRERRAQGRPIPRASRRRLCARYVRRENKASHDGRGAFPSRGQRWDQFTGPPQARSWFEEGLASIAPGCPSNETARMLVSHFGCRHGADLKLSFSPTPRAPNLADRRLSALRAPSSRRHRPPCRDRPQSPQTVSFWGLPVSKRDISERAKAVSKKLANVPPISMNTLNMSPLDAKQAFAARSHADGCRRYFRGSRIRTLFPARPSRLKAMSTPTARRKV